MHDERSGHRHSDGHHDSDGPRDQAFWDDLYAAQERVWSGRANPQVVAEAGHEHPGRALDVGSGEGGDAVWLAARGWSVTAVDLSTVALRRARAHAAETLPPEGAARISWEHRDVLAWTPPPASFDLVSSQYSHFPADDMATLTRRLAAAVAPGGTLLIVGHEASDHHAIAAHMFFTAEALADIVRSVDGTPQPDDTRNPRHTPGQDRADS